MQLLNELAAVGKHHRRDCSGRERSNLDLEPVPVAARVPEEYKWAARRADRNVDRAVVVVVGRGQRPAVHARAPGEPGHTDVREAPRPLVGQDTDRRSVLRQTRDRDIPAGEDEVGPAVERQIDPGRAPAGGAGIRGPERGTPLTEGRRSSSSAAGKNGVRLSTGVRNEEVEPGVAVVVT